MIELKWVRPAGTSTLQARLVYRVMQPCTDASGALCPGEWGEWEPVPTEIATDIDYMAAASPRYAP
ncbi:hypothetical protein [Rhodanobacter caeni]|uniref:Uncharacterized protein n=1 Tax=Rhodanobacter caeni TaxID=657654 RepID=A0ABP3EDJ4_9GAMM